jgi:hypothetical protein
VRCDTRKGLLILFLASLPFLYLASCGGGDGNGGEEFTVFDVTIRVLEVESQNGPTDCPESANLKLSLLTNGNNISGFAELLGLGKIGDARAISGLIEDNEFILEQFSVAVIGDVPPDAFFPASSISFNFVEFLGVLMDDDEDGVVKRMEGEVSGKVFRNQGDLITCDQKEFTGEFSGIARSPEGCVSRAEAQTQECPAEGFVNQCEQYANYACGGCEPINGETICVDLFFNVSECEVVDCLTVMCRTIINLEGLEDFGRFEIMIGDSVFPCFGSG